MRKPIQLLLLGLLPFIGGYLINFLVIHLSAYGIFMQVLLIVLWGAVGYKAYSQGNHIIVNTILLHIPALVVLLLLLYQELCLERYWFGLIGELTQMFYLPLLLAGELLVSPFSDTAVLWPAYIVEFVLMIAAGIVGAWIKKYRIKRGLV